MNLLFAYKRWTQLNPLIVVPVHNWQIAERQTLFSVIIVKIVMNQRAEKKCSSSDGDHKSSGFQISIWIFRRNSIWIFSRF